MFLNIEWTGKNGENLEKYRKNMDNPEVRFAIILLFSHSLCELKALNILRHPKTNISIDPNFDFKSIKIQNRGTSKHPCEAVKTVLFNCSQHVLRITRPASEDAKCGILAAESLIGSLALGCTVVIKTMTKHEFFHQLTRFQSLKSKVSADIITLQKFSNSIIPVYLICREDTLYGAFERIGKFGRSENVNKQCWNSSSGDAGIS